MILKMFYGIFSFFRDLAICPLKTTPTFQESPVREVSIAKFILHSGMLITELVLLIIYMYYHVTSKTMNTKNYFCNVHCVATNQNQDQTKRKNHKPQY